MLHCTSPMLQGLEVVHALMIFFCNISVSSRGNDEDEDFFVDDQDVSRLMIVTQVGLT